MIDHLTDDHAAALADAMHAPLVRHENGRHWVSGEAPAVLVHDPATIAALRNADFLTRGDFKQVHRLRITAHGIRALRLRESARRNIGPMPASPDAAERRKTKRIGMLTALYRKLAGR